MGILDQTERIATELYGADGILIEPAAKRQLDRFVKWGYGTLPVCMAKTQYSFSHDPSLLGAPTGFTVPVREFRLNAGAGFIVAILGNMMTMPGLPARPAVRGDGHRRAWKPCRDVQLTLTNASYRSS